MYNEMLAWRLAGTAPGLHRGLRRFCNQLSTKYRQLYNKWWPEKGFGPIGENMDPRADWWDAALYAARFTPAAKKLARERQDREWEHVIQEMLDEAVDHRTFALSQEEWMSFERKKAVRKLEEEINFLKVKRAELLGD